MQQHAPFWLSHESIAFPDPNLALDEPNGLLAIGGDLSPERVINAYRHGIFPWYSDDQPILWWSPDPRAVLFLNQFKISRSLVKSIRNRNYQVTIDKAFKDVIQACSKPRTMAGEQESGTWITDAMQQAYIRLHEQKHAHSVEVWHENKLIGGIYGVIVGQVFCGESMFSLERDASKVALAYWVEYLKSKQFTFIDCQLLNPHLASLGVVEIPRPAFLQLLKDNL